MFAAECAGGLPDLAAATLVQAPEAGVSIDIDLGARGATTKRALAMPGAAKKLFLRYDAVANQICPLTLLRSPDKNKSDFVWYVGTNARKTALAFITANESDEPRPVSFSYKSDLLPLTPTYRRVYSTNGGRTWQTIAYEPPHASTSGWPQPMPKKPWTIEVPPHSYQVAIVRLHRKKAK